MPNKYDEIIALAAVAEQNAASSSQNAENAESNAEISLTAAESAAASAQSAGQIVAAGVSSVGVIANDAIDQATSAAIVAKTDAETAKTGAELARDAAVDISNIEITDDVGEALVLNTGGSGPKTSAALFATYAVRSMVVYEDFSTKPDGLAGIADSGQTATAYDNGEPGAALVINGGTLTFLPTGTSQAAGYREFELDGPVVVLEATITQITKAVTDGSCEIIAFAESVDNPTTLAAGVVPDSPCHPVITSAGTWDYGVFAGGAYSIIASGTFAPMEIGEEYGWRVVLDAAAQTAHMTLPDGSTVTITDPRIAIPANFAVAECYANDDAATSSRFGFTSFAASDRTPNESATRATASIAARRASPSRVGAVVHSNSPATYDVVPGTSSDADPANLAVTVKVGSSGSVLVRMSGWYNLYAPQSVAFFARIDSSDLATAIASQASDCVVVNGAAAEAASGTRPLLRRLSAEMILADLVPGATYTIKYGHLATGVAVFQRDTGGGYAASIVATPL